MAKLDSSYQKIDAIVSFILENDRYLQPKRSAELSEVIQEKFSLGSIRTAQRYIAEARKEIRKLGKQQKEKAFDKAIRDREFLFSKAKGVKDDKGHYVVKPDYKLALEIIKDRDKLCGLYTDVIEHKGAIELKNINLQKLTDEQLTILESIIKKDEDPKPYLLSIGVNVDSN